jgi:hypothetical protein
MKKLNSREPAALPLLEWVEVVSMYAVVIGLLVASFFGSGDDDMAAEAGTLWPADHG